MGGSKEFFLDAYEIRIVKKQKISPVIYACSQASDHAAIRRAKSLIEDGDLVEVWRGLDCVYTTDMSPSPPWR
jgi:hypothetical protein